MNRGGRSEPVLNQSADGPLPDPRRLLIMSILAVIILAATVVIAALYAVQVIDRMSVEGEIQRARAAIIAVGAESPDVLQRDFVLDGARLTRSELVRKDEVAIPVSGSTDVLAWTPRRLGTAMLYHLVPLRLAASAMFLVGIIIVVRKLYGMTRELERRRSDAHKLALRDPLTGLANRLAFDRWLIDAENRGVEQIGLLYLDLDEFKDVNDRLGHGAGDEVLRIIAARIAGMADENDLVVRMGGDEFAFVRTGPINRAELSELAADIGTILSEPVRLGEVELAVGSSLGAALGRPGDPELIASADAALYRAKAMPGHTFVFADAA
jgi:diguanylate cyclase (GGDEF)-like protein